MANCYKVHCTNCGNIVTADQMAIDVDDIMKSSLAIMQRTNDLYRQAGEIFSEVRLGMYRTKFQLVQDGVLDGSLLRISGLYILQHIWKRYRIEEDLDRLIESANKSSSSIFDDAEDKQSSYDPLDDMDSIWGDNENDKSADNDDFFSGFELPKSLIDTLCFKMSLYGGKDTDVEAKRKYMERMMELLLKNHKQNFLKCDCRFLTASDDKQEGNEFVNAVIVRFENGEEKAYHHMVCPNCGDQFYIEAGQFEEKIIVMLGSSRVGKTAYLAALVDKLRPEYGQAVFANRITIIEAQDPKFKRFKEGELKKYRNNEKMIKTDLIAETVPLFSVRVQIANTDRNLILTFVDLPGETFIPSGADNLSDEADGRFLVNHRKICYSADIFWLCVAPAQIDGRLRTENEEAEADRVETDISMVLNNIRTLTRLMANRETSVPTAVMVTMSDKISKDEKLYEEHDNTEAGLYFVDGSKEVQFRIDVFNSFAGRVKSYLTSDHVRNITPELDSIFERKNYFSVAAYGTDPGETQEDGKAFNKPYGILMPFMWSLSALGYITPCRYEMAREGRFFAKMVERMVPLTSDEYLYNRD